MTGPQRAMATSAREVVLSRVRAALSGPGSGVRTRAEAPRTYHRSSDLDSAGLVELFAQRLRHYGATVVATSPDRVGQDIAELVRGRVMVPPGLPWTVRGAVVDAGADHATLDTVDTAVTVCAAACAPTGTIVLDASAGQGRRALSLVPDRHVCVVRAGQIVGSVPELIARLDPHAPITFISGPSATADIELHRVAGVHGPRQLAVIIVASAPGGGEA